VIDQRIDRRLARRADAEVPAPDQDARALARRIVDREIRARLAVRIEAQVVEQRVGEPFGARDFRKRAGIT
jgi:hypothetical protein